MPSSQCFIKKLSRQHSDTNKNLKPIVDGLKQAGLNVNILKFPNQEDEYVFLKKDFQHKSVICIDKNRVDLYYHKKAEQLLAIKSISIKYSKEDTGFLHRSFKEIKNEYEVLQALKQTPYVVQLYGYCIFKDHALFCMEALDDSLKNYILKRKDSGYVAVEEANIAKISVSIVNALNFLEEKKILHRDIKPANILLNYTKQLEIMLVKLTDFGEAKALQDSIVESMTFTGTFFYMAPERFTDKTYDTSNDIWSFGAVLAECAKGSYPFGDISTFGKFNNEFVFAREMILNKNTDELIEECFGSKYHTSLKDFTRSCLLTRDKRPKHATELMAMEFYMLYSSPQNDSNSSYSQTTRTPPPSHDQVS